MPIFFTPWHQDFLRHQYYYYTNEMAFMKKRLLISVLFSTITAVLPAQTPFFTPIDPKTASDDRGLAREINELEHQIATDPGYAEMEAWTRAYLAKKQLDQPENTLPDTSCIVTIPIVFHVFHPFGGNGVPYSQIEYAMQDLNRTYAGADADYLDVHPTFSGVKSYTKIRFALAQIDPQGNPTNGIVYYRDKQSGFGNGSDYNAQIASCAWDNYKYFNVYVMHDLYNDNATTNSGVCWYPSTFMSDNNLARMVYNYVYLGSGGSSYNNLEFNQTFTHECGHYLNLIHTFDGGNCAAAGDYCADTPPTDVAGAGCNAVRCNGLINGENYMDYNTTCYKNFTMDQNARMEAALNSPARFPLWQYDNLVATGVLNPLSDNACVMANPFLAYSKTSLRENVANDGGMEMPPVRIFACGGVAFSEPNTTLTLGVHYTLSNVPAGLSASITTDAEGKSATLLLDGNAAQHAGVHSVNNMVIEWKDAAFVGGNAQAIDHSTKTLRIAFRDPWRLICNATPITVTNTDTWKTFETAGPVPRYYAVGYEGARYLLENYGRGIITAATSNDKIAFVPAGTVIGAASPWRIGGSPGILYAPSHTALNGKTGYVGFRMQIGADFYYGWMRFSVSNTEGVTLLEYQYQEKPNEPIVAGGTQQVSVEDAEICAGENVQLEASGAINYTWNTGITGNTIQVSPDSTTQYIAFGTQQGCSVRPDTATVTVLPLPNTAVYLAGNTFLAEAVNADYQWLDCATGLPILGENNQMFVATMAGSYAVMVTVDGCTDTSVCVSAVHTQDIDMGAQQRLIIQPNPTTGRLLVRGLGDVQVADIQVFNAVGQLVSAKIQREQQEIGLDLAGLPKGGYRVRVGLEGGVWWGWVLLE